MINKVIEEAMTNMVRRIEALEDFNKKNYSNRPPKQFQQTPGLATPSQIWRIKEEGGDPTGMSKPEATTEIDRLLKNKSFNEKIQKQITEPNEVDTDDAGLDGDLL